MIIYYNFVYYKNSIRHIEIDFLRKNSLDILRL